MSRDSDQAPAAEVETPAKRPWKTPCVIGSAAVDRETETNPGGGTDLAASHS